MVRGANGSHRLAGWLLAGSLLLGSPLEAQNVPCDPFTQVEVKELCNAAIDAVRIVQPEIGLWVSGGPIMPGEVAPMAALGRARLGAAVTATRVHLPVRTFSGEDPVLGFASNAVRWLPKATLAIGVLPDGWLGPVRADIVGSMQLVQSGDTTFVAADSVSPRVGAWALAGGVGGRIGIPQSPKGVPSFVVSVTWNSVPELTYGDVSMPDARDDFDFAFDLESWHVRALAGYRTGRMLFGGGIGWNRYTSDVTTRLRAPTSPQRPLRTVTSRIQADRTLLMATVGVDLYPVQFSLDAVVQLGRGAPLGTPVESISTTAAQGAITLGISCDL